MPHVPRDAEGWIVNVDGSKSAVVHQWNRFWDLLLPWLSKLVDPTGEPGFQFPVCDAIL